jgi:hypothetical protein
MAEATAFQVEDDPRSAFLEELEATEAEIREYEAALLDADETITVLEEERDFLLDLKEDLAEGVLPESIPSQEREHVWDNNPVKVSGGVLDVIEKYRAQFSEKKAVSVCVNGKWLTLGEEMRADEPPLRLVAPPSGERYADAITGELASTKRDAVSIGAQTRHEVTIKVPAGGQLRFWFMVEEPGLDIDFSLLKLETGNSAGSPSKQKRNAKATGVRLPWHGYVQPEVSGGEEASGGGGSGSSDETWVGGEDNSRFKSRTVTLLHRHISHSELTHTHYPHTALILHSHCTHTALTLHPHCNYPAPTLHPHCNHTAITLHPHCTHHTPHPLPCTTAHSHNYTVTFTQLHCHIHTTTLSPHVSTRTCGACGVPPLRRAK